MGAKNYPSTMVATVALITSSGANSWRTYSGRGEKATNKPNAIVSLHQGDDSNNDSDDNDELVESFVSDDSDDGRSNSY